MLTLTWLMHLWGLEFKGYNSLKLEWMRHYVIRTMPFYKKFRV